jgi:hypothetical protein
VRIVGEDRAKGLLAEDYEFLSRSYSGAGGAVRRVPTPQVYRTNSILQPYFRFGAVQNRVLTNDGKHDGPQGPVPGILVNFAVSLHSSCYY